MLYFLDSYFDDTSDDGKHICLVLPEIGLPPVLSARELCPESFPQGYSLAAG